MTVSRDLKTAITLFFISILGMYHLTGFDKLLQVPPGKVEALRKSGWTLGENPALPGGWNILDNRKDGICRTEPLGKNEFSVFIRGNLLGDRDLLSIKSGDDTVEFVFRARSNISGAAATVMVCFYEKNYKYISAHHKIIPLTTEWKEYRVRLELASSIKGVKVAIIRPLIGSAQGAEFANAAIVALQTRPQPSPAVKITEKPLMDFDFHGVAGKEKLTDRTGKFTLYSDCGKLFESAGALQISHGARLRIPCPDRAFGEQFSISAWILKDNSQYYFSTPILSRGYSPPYGKDPFGPEKFDFVFELRNVVPGLELAEEQGLRTSGNSHHMNWGYVNRSHQIFPPTELTECNRWMHVVIVYDHGRATAYLNGIKVGEAPGKNAAPLMNCGMPFYLGATRVPDETDNRETAEMLIRRLRVYGKALTSGEVAGEFADHPAGIEPGASVAFKKTRNYYSAEMLPCDPEMTTRLPLTAEYLKKNIPDPYAGKSRMTGKISGNDKMFPTMSINDKRVAPISTNPTTWDPKPARTKEAILDFAAAGIDMFKIGDSTFWKGVGKYDFQALDELLEFAIKTNPRAQIYISLGINPPKWFLEQFPEELEEYYIDDRNPALGKRKFTNYGSPLGSMKYYKMCLEMIRAVVVRLEKSRFANHIFGYAFSGGSGGEWYWPAQWSGSLPGYSEPTAESFRNFLRRKYSDDERKLQAAWRQPNVTFASASVPPPAARLASENGMFRDGGLAAPVLDYREFIGAQTRMWIEGIAKTIKENAPAGKIVLTYFGYSLYYAGRGNILASSGHQIVREILASPYIDAIATPIDYLRRRGGEPGVNIAGFTGSAMMNGKLIAREEDLRTHLHPRLECGRTATLRETCEVIRRGMVYTMVDNYWFWYVFQALNHCYHQQEIMEDTAKIVKIAETAEPLQKRDVAEIALIFDEKNSLFRLASHNPLYSAFVTNHLWSTYENAHLSGAPFRLYFLEDLADPRMPDYKMYVFLNAWAVNTAQQKMIDAKVKRNNALVLWQYAPGYISERGFDLKNMERLTGIAFSESRGNHKVGKYSFSPGLFATDPAAEVLNREDGYATLVQRKFPGWRSIWTLLPPTPELLHHLALEAGIHCYTEPGHLLLANSSLVGVHTGHDGLLQVKFPGKYHIHELFTNRKIGVSDNVKETLPRGTTRIYQLDPP